MGCSCGSGSPCARALEPVAAGFSVMGALLLRYMVRQLQRLGAGSGVIHVEQARFKRPTMNIVERLRNVRSWHKPEEPREADEVRSGG